MKMSDMRLITSVPTYGPVDPRCAQDVRAGIMGAMQFGVQWVGDVSPDRSNFSDARNSTAQYVLDTPRVNGIVWIDSDMRLDTMAIASLLNSVEQFNAEFVTGVYHQRNRPHHAVFYQWNERRKLFRASENYAPNAFAPCDGCGFGFVYTSRKVLEDLANHKQFNRNRGWFPDERQTAGYGEDLSFCRQVMLMTDIQLYVNTSVILGHTGDPRVIYPEDQAKAKIEAPDAYDRDWGVKK